MKVNCDLCGGKFSMRDRPFDVVGGLYICCSDNHTPEELANLLGISEEKVYESLGLEKESK